MNDVNATDQRPSRLARFRSWVLYTTGLQAKLIVLLVAATCMVVGALYWFSYNSMRTSLESIYVQRAESVAAIISKSIQEKDYILYYSAELDADINRLMERYESVVGITVIGVTARGFLTIASSDPTLVGALVTAEERDRFSTLRDVSVAPVRLRDVSYLRAYYPVFSGPDLIGVVVADMSLDEQARAILRLSWQFGVASVLGCLLLAGCLYLALRGIVTRPVARLAEAMGAVARRKYDVEVKQASKRLPGTRVKDEISQLIDGFNLMTRVIHSHEQELLKLVVLDEVTGAYTLDHLRAELERELCKTRRYKHPTSVLITTIRGAEAASEEDQRTVLTSTAGFLVKNLRNVDVLFRVGPFRFASLMPETPLAGATVATGRVCTRIPDLTAEFPFPVELEIVPLGWGEEGAPAIEEVMREIVGRA
ncbi:MAG: HAMP domain-containing protein [Candidatus Bipolaricaulota bacterium]|nr:HAMP domain-containing protein [Candidatus Bipolaricaulota bacterium]